MFGGTVRATVPATAGEPFPGLRRRRAGRPHPQRPEVPAAPERQPGHGRAQVARGAAAHAPDLGLQAGGGTVLPTVGETVARRVWGTYSASAVARAPSISSSSSNSR